MTNKRKAMVDAGHVIYSTMEIDMSRSRAGNLPRSVLIFALLSGLSSCQRENVHKHDPDLAAKCALNFAKEAFLAKDEKKYYSYINQDVSTPLSKESVAKTIAEMHKDGFPSEIRKTAYEPLPGTDHINVFLTGKDHNGNTFYYRLLVTGESAKGYKVSGLFRSSGPYPQSPLYSAFEK